jgi:hypothetical protein
MWPFSFPNVLDASHTEADASFVGVRTSIHLEPNRGGRGMRSATTVSSSAGPAVMWTIVSPSGTASGASTPARRFSSLSVMPVPAPLALYAAWLEYDNNPTDQLNLLR